MPGGISASRRAWMSAAYGGSAGAMRGACGMEVMEDMGADLQRGFFLCYAFLSTEHRRELRNS
jgi:hypothetical protein